MKTHSRTAAKDAKIRKALNDGRLTVSAAGDVFNSATGRAWGYRSKSTAGYISGKIPGEKFMVMAHRVVAIALIPIQSSYGLEVNHIDGNKRNNAPSNLEWVTRSENMLHGVRTGLIPHPDVRLSKHPRTHLTDKAFRDIIAAKHGSRHYAKKYGVTTDAVRSTWHRHNVRVGRKKCTPAEIADMVSSKDPVKVLMARHNVAARTIRLHRTRAKRAAAKPAPEFVARAGG